MVPDSEECRAWEQCEPAVFLADHDCVPHTGRAVCEVSKLRPACKPLWVALYVRDDAGRLLLRRRAVDPDRGKWGPPGGKVGPGKAMCGFAAGASSFVRAGEQTCKLCGERFSKHPERWKGNER